MIKTGFSYLSPRAITYPQPTTVSAPSMAHRVMDSAAIVTGARVAPSTGKARWSLPLNGALRLVGDGGKRGEGVRGKGSGGNSGGGGDGFPWGLLLLAAAVAVVGVACTFDPSGLPGKDGGDEDAGNDGGADANVDANPDAAVYEAPQLVRPSDGLVLPPTRAFLSWRYDNVPPGKMIDHHEVCYTPNGMATTCELVTTPYYVIDPLAPTTIYEWSVRTCFDTAGTDCSPPSILRSFSTDNSLVGWWRVDEGMGVTAADSSVGGNTGTLQNGTGWQAGVMGQALNLDGVDDHVSVANASSLNWGVGNFAMTAWVRSNSTGGNQAIFDKRTITSGFEFYKRSTGFLTFYGEGCGSAVEAGDVTNGIWHHVVAVRNGMIVSLYLDGALVGSGACNDDFTNTAALGLGCNSPTLGCGEAFHGNLDDMKMLNNMTPEAIQNDYCSGQPLSVECQ